MHTQGGNRKIGVVARLFALFAIVLGVLTPAFASQEDLPKGTSSDALLEQDKMIRIYWPYLGQFIDKYPGYSAASYCQGSFTHEGYFEAALLLVNREKGDGIYIAVIGANAKDAKTVEINRTATTARGEDWIVGLQCNSYTKLLRLDNEIKSPNSAVEGSLKPISVLDGICLTPDPKKDGRSFVCYDYDRKKAKFTEIGNWLT